MRPSTVDLKRKMKHAFQLLDSYPGITNVHLQRKIKSKWGAKLSQKNLNEVKVQFESAGKAKKTVHDMKKVTHAKVAESKAPAVASVDVKSMTEEVLFDHNARDLGRIVVKRLPGVRKFLVEVDENGAIHIDWKRKTETSGHILV
jgi:hypothetical protein